MYIAMYLHLCIYVCNDSYTQPSFKLVLPFTFQNGQAVCWLLCFVQLILTNHLPQVQIFSRLFVSLCDPAIN